MYRGINGTDVRQEETGYMRRTRLTEIFKKDPAYIKAGIALAAGIICFACIYAWDNMREIKTNEDGQKVLERGMAGEDHVSGMRASVEDTHENIDVEVSGRTYTDEELRQAFDQAGEELEGLILGDNESLDEVRSDLDLVTEIPGRDIAVSWQTDRYDVIDLQGNVCQDELPDNGTPVKLTAELKYGEERAFHEFYVMVFPQKVSEEEALMDRLREEVRQADEETKTEGYMILPENIDGRPVDWSYRTQERAYAALVLGIGAACMLVVSAGQKKKEEEKKTIRQMQIDYPQIINKFNLYIRAGMTVRRAWFLIAGDYEKRRSQKNSRKAYEEMIAVMYQIRGGLPESECYENYGNRCRISAYRKFGTMLAQNMRKGSRGLTDLLAREAEEAFEDRKKLAKKLGEEAGTKLMIPMFLMLIVVFAIVIIPAFFSIQI